VVSNNSIGAPGPAFRLFFDEGVVGQGHLSNYHVAEVERPAIKREESTTLAFSKVDRRKILDLPSPATIGGLRDRAILSVGLQVGLRHAEIAALTVGGDLCQNPPIRLAAWRTQSH
jgi:site-specific recombinase XerC